MNELEDIKRFLRRFDQLAYSESDVDILRMVAGKLVAMVEKHIERKSPLIGVALNDISGRSTAADVVSDSEDVTDVVVGENAE